MNRFSILLLLCLAACSGDSERTAHADKQEKGKSEARKVVRDYVDNLNLSGPIPPGGCEVLTENIAVDILGEDVRKKPGGGDQCTFVSRSGDSKNMVSLLITSFPLESFTVDDDPLKIALTLEGWAGIASGLHQTDDISGKPAFIAEDDDTSILFHVPGVKTTSTTSAKPIGEIIVQASLKGSQSHDDRLSALNSLAERAQKFLNDQAK